jgi:hypothetical protein
MGVEFGLILREECMSVVFENGVLKRMFRPNRKVVSGGWRILHNEELRDLCLSPYFIKEIKLRRLGGGST